MEKGKGNSIRVLKKDRYDILAIAGKITLIIS